MDHAIDIAKAYLEKNRNADLRDPSTYETDAMCHEGQWLVTIYGLPARPGGHVLVIVGVSGEVLGIDEGR